MRFNDLIHELNYINKMNTLLLIGPVGTWEIIIIVLVVLLLFGAKKIPELMKGIGKGIRGFKEGMKGIEDEINNAGDEEKKS